MAIYNFIAPVSGIVSPYNFLSDANSKTAWNKWKKEIENASKLSNVPQNMIYAFMMVESNGIKEKADQNPYTPGLMQFNPNYAFEIIEKEKNKGRMSAAEEEFLAKKGIKFKQVGSKWQITGTPVKQVGIERQIAKSTVIDPEFNIYVGSMYLGQYMDEPWGRDADGTVRMDRIVTIYNGGRGTFNKNSASTKTTSQLLSSGLPYTTKEYIKKVLGTNGTMHTAFNLNLPKTV